MKWVLIFIVVVSDWYAFNEGCRIGCLNKSYDTGFWKDQKCYCSDFYEYSEMAKKKFILTSVKIEQHAVPHYTPEIYFSPSTSEPY